MKLRLPAFAISTMPLFPFWAKLSHVIARNVLVSFSGKHPEAKVSLEGWHTIMEAAQWRSTDEVQKAAPKAKVLNRERARFEVAGGNCRLVAAFDFRRQIAFDLRPHLLLSAEDQSQPGVRRPDRRYQANRRADLARQLYRLRSRILRRRDLQARTPCKSLRIKSVAHVFGIIRNPCVRYGPYRNGALGEIRTPDPRNRNPMLYPAELRAPKYFERVGTPTFPPPCWLWLQQLRTNSSGRPIRI